MKNPPLPSLEILNSIFELDKNSPSFLNRKLKGPVTTSGRKYYRTTIQGKSFAVHRIVYAIYNSTTNFQEYEIDHKDRNTKNNNPENLRLATGSENSMNSKKKTSYSGHRGVRWDDLNKKWRAEIQANNERINLGSFLLLSDAVAARQAGEIKYHGEFRFIESQEEKEGREKKLRQIYGKQISNEFC